MCNTLSIPEKFALAQRIVVGYYPMLSSFYSMCNFQAVSNDNITLRLNTRTGVIPIMEYNVDFVKVLSERTLAMLLSIELFRLILHHPTTRLMYPITLCYRASNIICSDKRILRYCTFDNPELKENFPTVDEIQLLEPRFDKDNDFTLEKIFSILNRSRLNDIQADADMPMPNIPSEGSSAPETKDVESPEEDDNQNDEEGESDQPNGNMESESDKDSEGDGEESDKMSPDEAEALQKHFSKEMIENNTEAWSDNDLIDRKIVRQVNKELEKSHGWGDMAGNLYDLIKTSNTFVYDPRAIFTKFSSSVFSDVMEFTRMKPPRRLGQEFIGIIPGQRHDTQASVLIGLDSSGSMSDEELMMGLGFMKSSLQLAEIHFCWWDCKCSDITLELVPKSEYKLQGRGGTNPQCVIDKIRKERLYFDGIVIISDCEFKWDYPGGREKICVVETSKSCAPDWCRWHFKLSDLLKRI